MQIFFPAIWKINGFDSNKKGKSTETYKAEILWVL